MLKHSLRSLFQQPMLGKSDELQSLLIFNQQTLTFLYPLPLALNQHNSPSLLVYMADVQASSNVH